METNQQNIHSRGISLKLIGLLMSVFAVIVSSVLVVSLFLIRNENQVVTKANENYLALKDASNDIQAASDELTNDVRLFVANADEKYMAAYFVEANERQRRENALDVIHELSESTSKHEAIHANISMAVGESMGLMDMEYYAMKLICENSGVSYDKFPAVAAVDTSKVLPENRKSEAVNAVFGTDYNAKKNTINYYITLALEDIDDLMHENGVKAADTLSKLLAFQTVVIIANVVFMAVFITFLYFYVLRPMNYAVKALNMRKPIEVHSNREFNYLADVYNNIREQNGKVREKLVYEAEHDKLTGIYNRTGYASIYRRMKLDTTIYILVDADGFKKINDEYGHEMGDKVLIRIADTLQSVFNEDNFYVFRIGGDEFTVLLEEVDEEMNDEVIKRCQKVNQLLSTPKGKIPPVSLSIGVAHGNEEDTTDSLYKKADLALYKVKHNGKGSVELYTPDLK